MRSLYSPFTNVFFVKIYICLILLLAILSTVDSASYLYYTENSWIKLILKYKHRLIYFILNEPIWLLIMSLTSLIFPGSIENKILVIGFSIFFAVMYYIIKFHTKTKTILTIFVLLVFPVFITNSIVNLRMKVALAIFIIVFYSKNKIIKYILILSVSFIYISFLIILFLYFLTMHIAKKEIFFRYKAYVIATTILVFSYFLSQAHISSTKQFSTQLIEESRLDWLFWMMILSIFLLTVNIKKLNTSFVICRVYFSSISFLIEPISRLFFLVLKRRYGEIPQTLKGFILLYKDTFNIIKLGLKHE